MTRTRERAALMLAAIPLLAASCDRAGEDDDMPTPEEYVGQDAKVLRETLQFTDEAEAAHFDAARACFAGRHDAGVAAGQEWRHYPLREIGNFLEEDWCRGVHSRNCAGGSFMSERGDEWYGVSTLHYDSSFPEVFGIGVSAGQLPRDGDWGISFSYRANGARIVGEGVGVSFHRFEGKEIAEAVHLGDAYSYQVEEDTLFVLAPGNQDQVLARLVRSPASLRATALESLDELQAIVEQHVQAGLARKCVYGAYEGDGIPPECTLTPLTPQEQDAAVAAARAELGARRAAVEQHAELFHQLLTDLVVFDKCWGTPLTVAPSLRRGATPVVEVRDAADVVRAEFQGAVWFWAPLDERRLLVGASGWRPLEGEPGQGPDRGNANQYLVEITLPDEGPPVQRMLLESHRGDMGCRLSPDGASGACVVRHVKTQVQDLALLDLSGEQVALRHATTAEEIPVKSCYTKPQLRYRDDHFEVQLHEVETRGDVRWVALRPLTIKEALQ